MTRIKSYGELTAQVTFPQVALMFVRTQTRIGSEAYIIGFDFYALLYSE